jgi:hypothetical protein
MFGLRRLFWAVLFALLLVLVYRCSAENAAQLQQYTRHHHPAVTANSSLAGRAPSPCATTPAGVTQT